MQPYLAMIFVNTKRADELHAYLTVQGLKVAKDSWGYCSSRERKRIMNQGENLDFGTLSQRTWQRVELTLKVSAMLSMMPFRKTCPLFVHRVGRTGRNGLPGYSYYPLPAKRITTRYPWSWRN